MTKNLSFSYSKMGMYKECPQKYKFRYVHMIPELPKYYFAFGSALHSVMEFIYDPARPAFPTLAEALSYFNAQWSQTTWQQKGYPSEDKELAAYAEGRREIEAYYQKHAATFARPLSVEMKSTLEIDGLSLISILDRLDYLGEGQVKILDYKTGKTVQREPDQLYMYQKVVETSPVIKTLVQQKDPSVKNVRVGQLAFYHLPSLTEMTFERAPDKEIVDFWQNKVLATADHIRAGQFSPTPSEQACRWCDYRNICPVFTGKDYTGPSGAAALPLLKGQAPTPTVPAPQKVSPTPEKSPMEVLADNIDRYGALLEETEKLRQDITAQMQTSGFARHFGAHFQAELSSTSKTVFENRDKVLEILKKYNLLAKTLVPTQSTLAALLTDPSVPSQAKQELQQCATTRTENNLHIEKAE